MRLLRKNLAFNNGGGNTASPRQLRLERQAVLLRQQTDSSVHQASGRKVHTDGSASQPVGDVGSHVRDASHSERGEPAGCDAGEGNSVSDMSSGSRSSGASLTRHSSRFLYAPRAFFLPWGDGRAAQELKQSLWDQTDEALRGCPSGHQAQHQHQQDRHQGAHRTGSSGSPDLILMAEVVYGSDPGVWEALIKTLKTLCSPGTLVLQVGG